jgi:4-hydroxybenzoate polyprenyltransferase
MKPYLKLFRIPNVLMIGLTLVLMRYAVIAPMLSVYEMELKLPFTAFLAYVIATMLVAAAGYAINDYYDRNIDMLNRKAGDIIVGEKVPAARVLVLYRALNIVALIFAGYASYYTGIFILIACYLIMIGLLYFYTTTYKKQLLVGNIIVSLATAMVPVAVYLYEIPPVVSHYKYYIVSGAINIGVIIGWITGFSVFAFLSGLAREIIKDMEDFEGDRFAGRNTVPIVWGMSWARNISVVLIVMILAGLGAVYYAFFISAGHPDFITLVYFSAFLVIPLVYNLYQLIRAKTVADYKFCGDLLKIIMLAGILYAPVVWYIIHKTFEI